MLSAVFLVAALGAAPRQEKLKIFDKTPKTLIVNGYSTSFHWPRILQRKIDKYGGGKLDIKVVPATKGGRSRSG